MFDKFILSYKTNDLISTFHLKKYVNYTYVLDMLSIYVITGYFLVRDMQHNTL